MGSISVPSAQQFNADVDPMHKNHELLCAHKNMAE